MTSSVQMKSYESDSDDASFDEERGPSESLLTRGVLMRDVKGHKIIEPNQPVVWLLFSTLVFLLWAIVSTVIIASYGRDYRGGESVAKLPESWVRTAVVMRHCARSTKATAPDGSPAPLMDNYSVQPFPSFGVAPMMCTPRGLKIAENQGAFIKTNNGFKDLKMSLDFIKIISDGIQRDVDSAINFAKGLGYLTTTLDVSWNSDLFNPFKAKLCPGFSKIEMDSILEEQLSLVGTPEYLKDKLGAIQNILGEGSYKVPLDEIPDVVKDGEFSGGSAIAAAAVSTWMMQYGSGMEVGWGDVTPAELYDLFKWLRSQTGSGSLFYMGHDTTIDQLATLLELSWSPTPYPNSAVPASSMLVFQVKGTKASPLDSVLTAHFGFSDFATDNGEITLVPAIFSKTKTNEIRFEDMIVELSSACSTPTAPPA